MPISKNRRKELEDIASEWLKFTQHLNELTEEEAKHLLDVELSTKRRESFANRLYGRYNRTRRAREMREIRAALYAGATTP